MCDARSSTNPSVIALGLLYVDVKRGEDRATVLRPMYRPKTKCVYTG